ncbi:SusC/RagA family TonB-linked outer membrane protein [Pedobacter sp. AW1-32]|uniref:SusC/RagA family TonB-linked outer membrane protein n=1 Tax=Pedobacter sp. AW1-32 TaxID=3383026 RepID=UPI003FEE159D
MLSVPQVYAQQSIENTKIKLSSNGKTLSEVLQSVEKQSGFTFSYDQNEINLKQTIRANSTSTLSALLAAFKEELGLEHSLSGKVISLRQGAKPVRKQSRTISGKVTDQTTGEFIPGANVFIKGTKQGAVTNSQGTFVYTVTAANIDKTVLMVSYIGMKSKEVILGKDVFFSVELENESFGMDEVVVTGSYTKDKRREEVVGSIAQISAERLQTDRPIESFDKMLEGMVAGVYVETTTELNTPVKVNIRGQGSLPSYGTTMRTTSSQPLYVIDGLPVYEQQPGNESSAFTTDSYLNPLSNINPDDIKSISILKDATASALYGANAANGVIIITTKAGKADRTRFNFNYDTGVSSFINEYKWLSGPQYYSLLREAYINDGRSVADASSLAGSKTNDVNWFDLTNRNAVYHNAGLQVEGGNENTTFRFSGGYRNQQANSYGNDLEKVYLRLRVDHKVAEKFSIGFNLSSTLTQQNALSNYGSVILPPNQLPYNADGSYAKFQGVPNPLAVLAQNENSTKGVDLQAIANASYRVSKSILFSGTLGANAYQTKQTRYNSGLNSTGETQGGSLRIYDRNRLGYTGFLQGTYDKTFADIHTVNFLIGTQVENEQVDLLLGQGTGFTFDRLRTLSSATTRSSSSSNTSNATVSYYSQLGYDIKKKYFANFNARIDKSSIFGGDKQVSLNGSAGLAWIISKENFLAGNKFLTFLRLRSTFGSTGNSRIGNYSARGLYNFGTNGTYDGNIVSYPASTAAPNPDLGWEKNYKLNFGLDFTLLNKVQVTAEYYNNTITDMISSVDVAQETGFSQISANTSKMRNNGFELSINTDVFDRKEFNWNIAFNFGINHNKLLAYNNNYGALYGYRDYAYAFKVGNSSTAIYGYESAGVNPDTGIEMFYGPNRQLLTASQINALPISNSQVLGERLPDFQGGLVNRFTYKNFTLTFNILYSYGADAIFSNADESDGRNLQHRNQSVNLLDRWQRPGDITEIPKLSITPSLISNSSRYVYDVSYLKLSNVSVGYTFKDSVIKKLHLSRLSLFANGTNLFYLYNDAGTKGRNGIAEKRFVYPESMALTAGIKIGL